MLLQHCKKLLIANISSHTWPFTIKYYAQYNCIWLLNGQYVYILCAVYNTFYIFCYKLRIKDKTGLYMLLDGKKTCQLTYKSNSSYFY